MARGRFFLIAILVVSVCGGVPAALLAEDSSQTDGDSRHVFQGQINANSVYVRSRASEDAYPTMKLSRGMKITVIGIKGQWLKIEPPEGSFAYVPKSFVIMRGDGTVGRMNREWMAKAGSDLNDLAAQPIATVHEGEDVTIIGQHNEYFKIKPPKESYLWINKQFVDPVREVVRAAPPVPQPQVKEEPAVPAAPKAIVPQTNDEVARGTANPRPGSPSAGTATPPMPPTATPDTGETVAAVPATQPAEPPSAFAEFDRLEQEFNAAAVTPIDQQPIPELKAGYEKLTASDELPSSVRATIEIRVAQLKVRDAARNKYLAVLQEEKQSAERRKALLAEQQEIQERIKKNDIQVFAAVGTLRPSSLQIGQNGILYRLTDPATGRTVIYVRSNDQKMGTMLGQFIGVRGTIRDDVQLKSVIENPAECLPVEQSKVNQSIAAQVVPPSLTHAVPAATIAPASPSTQPAGFPMHANIDLGGAHSEPQ
jgi:SH3-like domain-containing protein